MHRELSSREGGAALIEMALTVVLLVLIAALALPRLGTSISSTFSRASGVEDTTGVVGPGGGRGTEDGWTGN